MNQKPDAGYISKLKTKLETRYAPQESVDREMLSYYKQRHLREMWDPKLQKKLSLKAVGAGMVGFIVDQDSSVLNSDPAIKVNARGGQDAERLASQTVEPWLELSRKAARRRQNVDGKKIQDLRLYGRAWSSVLPVPRLWGGPDFEKNEGESDEDFNARVEKQKRERFPILWRWVNARGTWPIFDDYGGIAEVIEIRKVDAETIKERFPNAKIPTAYERADQVDVVEYANHRYVATVIPDQNSPEELHSWEHHMGGLPYVLFEGDPLPDDPDAPGERWRGAAYHALGLVQVIDETLSDIRTAARAEVTGPTVIKQDPDKRAGAAVGKPEPIEVVPGMTLNLFTSESFERGAVSQLNPALMQLVGMAKQLIDQIALSRPALIGDLESGVSSVALKRAARQAEVELKAGHRALEEGAAEECRLMLRAVVALSERFPEAPDAVVVRKADGEHGSKEVELRPKNLLEWEPMVQCSIEQNLPVDEGGDITNFAVGTKAKMFSRQTGRELFGKFSDPLGEEDKIKEEELDDVLHQFSVQFLSQRVMQGLQQTGAESPEKLPEGMPVDAQEALAMSFEEEGDTDMANMFRGKMNESREGRGQLENAEARALG